MVLLKLNAQANSRCLELSLVTKAESRCTLSVVEKYQAVIIRDEWTNRCNTVLTDSLKCEVADYDF